MNTSPVNRDTSQNVCLSDASVTPSLEEKVTDCLSTPLEMISQTDISIESHSVCKLPSLNTMDYTCTKCQRIFRNQAVARKHFFCLSRDELDELVRQNEKGVKGKLVFAIPKKGDVVFGKQEAVVPSRLYNARLSGKK